ncbi:phenylalanine--tRNA ligase subunit beta [Compostibacter hankyongensis]|uniref:Phenylalanine--tRNA ligase beta subunit n=1 Tax=Compostibacter hankyongensis TaxID=1007089 RepID=A0ABP8G962_9BACT
MNISYRWLCTYLPLHPAPEKLAEILTAVGLEVEKLSRYEAIKGSLEGLVIGKVLEVAPHPDADKLKLTRVDTGGPEPLQIVCGAPNVAAGQQVVVAPAGSTLYPAGGDPLILKKTKIRGVESQGMICAEDEIGLGTDHSGILVLTENVPAGTSAGDYFRPYTDWVYEIGLTPNRMDAMSHIGVARDVCAWLSHSEGKSYKVVLPDISGFRISSTELPVTVKIENAVACPRYTGLTLSGITAGASPSWMQERLKAIGVRPVSNIVDISNYILHETGQPLHAFDADAIRDRTVIVKNLPPDTPFVTLDEKKRSLHAEDLMICDTAGGLCLAGIFGGLDSGVKSSTTRIFLESAFFDPATIRRSSFRHGLRTDAALRFEKGVDISNLIFALKRAAVLICELCGGHVSSEITDVYPAPQPPAEIILDADYLQKLSGKTYPETQVRNILESLGFEVQTAGEGQLRLTVPYSKPDIRLPADIAEEVMRIDGFDNVLIPTHMTITPSRSAPPDREALREKATAYLSSNGFFEIFTNSITNSRYYTGQPVAGRLVRMLNSLSAELDVMRPSLLETGLESVAHNLNRQQTDLLFFELGKSYLLRKEGASPTPYEEREHLCLYLTGNKQAESWLGNPVKTDAYFLKGHLQNLLTQLGATQVSFEPADLGAVNEGQHIYAGKEPVGYFGKVTAAGLQRFGIRQPVWYADLDWSKLLRLSSRTRIRFSEIPRYPAVRRDLALILSNSVKFSDVEAAVWTVKTPILQEVGLFDVFESEKLGPGKKSYAVSFTFRHPEKTLTDREIEKAMQQIIRALETGLQAEIRK